MIYLFYGVYGGNLEAYLRKNGFVETAELMKYLNGIYQKNKLLDFSECKDYLLEIINSF